MTSYFDVYTPSIAEYENEEIPKIHLTVQELPWDPSTNDSDVRSSRSDQYPYHSGKETSNVSVLVSYSLAYDATDVMDNDNLVTALSAQIQISIALICMTREPSVETIVLAKQLGIT